MRGWLRRLWWAMPWLQVRVDRLRAFLYYAWSVLKCATLPTWGFIKNRRVDAGLVLVAGVVFFYRSQPSGKDKVGFNEVISGMLWGLVAVGGLVVAVALWNLALAPYRVYSQMREAKNARIEELAVEVGQLRYSIGQEAAIAEKRLGAVSRQLGTELRDIRHKIEIVKSTRPHPHYSRGFQLPAARWDQFDDELAEHPDLYRVVERAYTAAHHVNEALYMRRTRLARPDQTIGVIPDDGLDTAYEEAGKALDALRELHGEIWESAAQRTARLVTEDMLRESVLNEATEPSGAGEITP